MGKFNEYTQKETPKDADSLIIYDAAAKANKLSPFSGIWNWIVEKLTNAVISNLQTNNQTVLGAINELNSKPSIRYTNGTFSPIYSTSLYSGTVQYDLSEYPTNSILLIFYANGGMSMINIWGGSYSLVEIKKATNGVEISCDYSTKKMSVTVPEKAATILSIIQIK